MDMILNFFEWFTQLSFAQLSWLSVIAYILHYAEEGPRLVEWIHKHSEGITKKYNYTQKKLNLENILLFSFTLINVILLNIYPDSWILRAGIFSTGIGFIGNTFFHVFPTLKTGIYSPGVVTASMIFPPVFIIYIWKMSQEGLFTLPIIGVAVVMGVIMLPLSIKLTHDVILRNE